MSFFDGRVSVDASVGGSGNLDPHCLLRPLPLHVVWSPVAPGPRDGDLLANPQMRKTRILRGGKLGVTGWFTRVYPPPSILEFPA